MTPEEELNQKWDNRKIIEETVKSLNMHSEPAPRTLEMFAEQGKQMGEIKTILAVQAEKHTQIDEKLDKIQKTGEQTLSQATYTNGRVSAIEQWVGEAKIIIEKLAKDTGETAKDYTINKTRMWTAVTLLVFLGGTIITLSIMAINSKIDSKLERSRTDIANEVVQLFENKYNIKLNEN